MQKIINFSEKLQKALDFRGFSQREFARKLGVSSSYVSLICQGKKGVSAKKIQEIADLLEIPVSYFFNEAAELDNSVSQQANGNAGSVSQSVAVGGGEVGAKLEIMNVKLDLIVEMLRNMKK